jgi:hypothetical protein
MERTMGYEFWEFNQNRTKGVCGVDIYERTRECIRMDDCGLGT